jgi:hypothetical protein
MSVIKLDRERPLRYTTNSVISLVRLRGMSIESMLLPENNNEETARALLYGGLITGDPTMTLEKVGDLMDLYRENGGDPEAVTAAIVEAMNASKIKTLVQLDLKGDGEKNS